MTLLTLWAAPAFADESLFESFGKAAGLVSPTPNPPDFVKASRPVKEPDAIPAFAPPQEPRSKVKTAAELKAMDADLERASRGQRGAKPAADVAKAKSRPKKPEPIEN
jgi:hypothetical protein